MNLFSLPSMPMRVVTSLALAMLLVGCASNGSSPSDESSGSESSTEGPLEVTVRWNETRQTLHGFGASDAWSIQFVG